MIPAVGEAGNSVSFGEDFEEMIVRLKSFFKPEKIILFGSHAKNTSGPDSDYDLILILKGTDLSGIERLEKARQVLWGTRVAADVLIFTEYEVEELKTVPSSIVAAALEEGKVIYAA